MQRVLYGEETRTRLSRRARLWQVKQGLGQHVAWKGESCKGVRSRRARKPEESRRNLFSQPYTSEGRASGQ